jgi:hypothetical protein
MCARSCVAPDDTSRIIFFPSSQTPNEVWVDFAHFCMRGTTTLVSSTTAARHYWPSMCHCHLSCFVLLLLNFCRKLCMFLSSILVYSIDIGLSITALRSFSHPVGCVEVWDKVMVFTSWGICSGSHSAPLVASPILQDPRDFYKYIGIITHEISTLARVNLIAERPAMPKC